MQSKFAILSVFLLLVAFLSHPWPVWAQEANPLLQNIPAGLNPKDLTPEQIEALKQQYKTSEGTDLDTTSAQSSRPLPEPRSHAPCPAGPDYYFRGQRNTGQTGTGSPGPPSTESRAEEFFSSSEPAVGEVLGVTEKSEGEKLIVAPVDLHLKQYGYDFFKTGAGGFTPENLAPVGPDYMVGPGRPLAINIWGNINGTYSVTVGRNGDIAIPRLERFTSGGRPLPRRRRRYTRRSPNISPISK